MSGRFTDAEMEAARNVDLPELLASLGYQVKRIGSYYTTKEMDSLRIRNRRTWFRYSENVGGDAITFLQHFCGKSFPEAVDHLLQFQGRARDSPAVSLPAWQKEKKPFVLPPAHSDQRRVFAYLRKRGIAAQVIQGFIRAGLLYEDAEYHNCVFVGRDEKGTPQFASKRGTASEEIPLCSVPAYGEDSTRSIPSSFPHENRFAGFSRGPRGGKPFKGDVEGSNKDIAFRLPCDPANPGVLVFEAPIDLMSYCTLHREVRSNAVALCGLYQGPLDTYLREHPHLKSIILCLDADKWGREAAVRLTELYSQKGYHVMTRAPPRGKDWNEFLQEKTKNREKAR